MVQRWLKTLAFLSIPVLLFTACQKTNYSPDEPLTPEYTPSLFIGSQNQYLYALVPETGKKKWETNIGANMQATPIVVGEFLIVAAEDSLFKLDVNTGKVIRRYSFENENLLSFIATPCASGNTIYVASTNGLVYAIDVKTDQLKWKYTVGVPITSSPTLYNGQLIVCADKIHSINVLNGVASWTSSINVASSGAVVSAPYIYVGGADGTLYALDITTGATSWTYDPNPEPATILGSPIVYGGNVIFGSSDYNVYCIDSVAKQPRWVIKTEQRVHSSPFAKDQVVYFGSYDYYLYAVDIIDGVVKWKVKTDALIKSSPLVHQGTVYVGSFDKHMYAFDTSGTLLWKNNIDGLIETSPVLYDMSKTYYPSVTGFNEQIP